MTRNRHFPRPAETDPYAAVLWNFLSQLHLLREHDSDIHKTNVVSIAPEYHRQALPNLDFFYFKAEMVSRALSRGSATRAAAARASKVLQ